MLNTRWLNQENIYGFKGGIKFHTCLTSHSVSVLEGTVYTENVISLI